MRRRSGAVRLKPSAMRGEARLRGLARAVGLKPSAMQGEARLRGLARAVGLKPSAMQGEARLRGLYRIIYSKTISPRLYGARPICAGATLRMRAEPSLSAWKPLRGYGVLTAESDGQHD